MNFKLKKTLKVQLYVVLKEAQKGELPLYRKNNKMQTSKRQCCPTDISCLSQKRKKRY